MTKLRSAGLLVLVAGTSLGLTGRLSAQDVDLPVAVDVEGHEYRTVRIGSRTWFAENLRAFEPD